MAAAAAASRRRPAPGPSAFAYTTGVPSTADGSVYVTQAATDGDGETGTCALAQLGSGALFAFLLGSLGFILTGDAERSFVWLGGLILGGTLGTFATRGAAGVVDPAPAGDEGALGAARRRGRDAQLALASLRRNGR